MARTPPNTSVFPLPPIQSDPWQFSNQHQFNQHQFNQFRPLFPSQDLFRYNNQHQFNQPRFPFHKQDLPRYHNNNLSRSRLRDPRLRSRDPRQWAWHHRQPTTTEQPPQRTWAQIVNASTPTIARCPHCRLNPNDPKPASTTTETNTPEVKTRTVGTSTFDDEIDWDQIDLGIDQMFEEWEERQRIEGTQERTLRVQGLEPEVIQIN